MRARKRVLPKFAARALSFRVSVCCQLCIAGRVGWGFFYTWVLTAAQESLDILASVIELLIPRNICIKFVVPAIKRA
jgi:TRAP-type C4-dicarboxylate transport system permease small subunit